MEFSHRKRDLNGPIWRDSVANSIANDETAYRMPILLMSRSICELARCVEYRTRSSTELC